MAKFLYAATLSKPEPKATGELSKVVYYMRARHYNSDIKRFINQDIKTGGIGDSQSLNRYAYCEGNPVSLVDPFGLSPENTQGQEVTGRFEKWHSLLGMGGIVFDGCDIANGVLYLMEGNTGRAFISFACAAPLAGNIIAGVSKCARVARKASTAARIMETCRAVQKLGTTADIAVSSVQAAQKDRSCKTQEDRIKCAAINMLKSYAMGAALTKSAKVLQNAAKKALPALATSAQKMAEGIGKRAGKGGSETNYILFNKTHKDSIPKPKGTGPNGGRLQSHHGLQKEWAKANLSRYGYDERLAPTVTIETGKDVPYPHTIITNAQNARRDARLLSGQGKWSTSLQEELSYIVTDFRSAGFSDSTIDKVLQQQYDMLEKLNVPYERIKY